MENHLVGRQSLDTYVRLRHSLNRTEGFRNGHWSTIASFSYGFTTYDKTPFLTNTSPSAEHLKVVKWSCYENSKH